MYCSNCGSTLPENAGFCPSCGAGAGQQATGAQVGTAVKTALPDGTFKITSIIMPAVLTLLMFLKWISMPIIAKLLNTFGSALGSLAGATGSMGSLIPSSFSIIDLMYRIKLFSSLNDFAGSSYAYSSSSAPNISNASGLIIAFIVLLFVVMLVSMAFFAVYLFHLFKNKTVKTKIFTGGLVCTSVLFTVSLIGMFVVNGIVSNETYGIVTDMLSLTFGAYLTGIISILALIFLPKRLDAETNRR
ncbi:zinc ribbon domain-containing protein [Oscillospiraceae bacterium WX1]